MSGFSVRALIRMLGLALAIALGPGATAALGQDNSRWIDSLFAPGPQGPAPQERYLPTPRGEVVGAGPIRVAVLLPLSGGAGLSGPAAAIRNGAVLGVERAGAGGAVHLVIKDTRGEPGRARQLAQEAVAEGAQLILGPIRADAVAAAGAVAQAAGVPLIGFSSTSGVAGQGVFLLSVLPEVSAMRVLGHARAQGARAVAAIVADNRTGRAHAEAFMAAAASQAMSVAAIERFADEAGARRAVEALVPLIRAGRIEALYLPDAATAPSFGILLSAADIGRSSLVVLGAPEWAGNGAIAAQPFLAGAVYPGIDPAGLARLAPAYRARFGVDPHALAPLGFAAGLLANDRVLVQSVPPFADSLLARAAGFDGLDGGIRFHLDGRGEYALALFAVRAGGAETIDPARFGGISREVPGAAGAGSGNAIPPVGTGLMPD